MCQMFRDNKTFIISFDQLNTAHASVGLWWQKEGYPVCRLVGVIVTTARVPGHINQITASHLNIGPALDC